MLCMVRSSVFRRVCLNGSLPSRLVAVVCIAGQASPTVLLKGRSRAASDAGGLAYGFRAEPVTPHRYLSCRRHRVAALANNAGQYATLEHDWYAGVSV